MDRIPGSDLDFRKISTPMTLTSENRDPTLDGRSGLESQVYGRRQLRLLKALSWPCRATIRQAPSKSLTTKNND
jgi:hypothetical protein